MYGDLLGKPGPMGAPPAIKGYPQPVDPPAPAPTPTPPPGVGPIAGAPPQPSPDVAARLAYQQQHENFLHALAADFSTGKISADDLKKGASYTGLEPYHDWKNSNVLHLKEAAKASE